jgi:hypothetical protein
LYEKDLEYFLLIHDKRMKYFFVLLSFCTVSFLTQPVWAQPTNVIDYSKPQNYEIGGIEVVGAQYSDPRTIAALSSLSVGQTIKSTRSGYTACYAKFVEIAPIYRNRYTG